RRKEKEVLTTDEDDFDIRVQGQCLLQAQRRIDAGKATTQDDDALPLAGRALGAVSEENHGNLLASRWFWGFGCMCRLPGYSEPPSSGGRPFARDRAVTMACTNSSGISRGTELPCSAQTSFPIRTVSW